MKEASLTTATASVNEPNQAVADNRTRDAAVLIAIFLLFWGIYLATGCYQRNPFNAHVYLAYSLLRGRFDLINPPGYFETVQTAGRSYIAYGIGPSLLMLPCVAIWGMDFHQAAFMAALSTGAVTIWSSTLRRLGIHGQARSLLTVSFGLGSLFWFYGGANGTTWSLMHVTTVFGLTFAIHETLGESAAAG